MSGGQPRVDAKVLVCMKWIKRILLVMVVAFVAFYLIGRPNDAASAVRGGIDAVANAVNSFFTFFSALAG